MSLRLFPRRARLPHPAEGAAAPCSTQVYHWPAGLDRATRLLPALCSGAIALGLAGVLPGSRGERWDVLAAGLMLALLAGVALAALAVAHVCLARDVAFTTTHLLLGQTGRGVLRLPFAVYGENREWVADLSAPEGSIRLLLLKEHRGCTIWAPPPWLRTALEEIERIQREEGWYGPEE